MAETWRDRVTLAAFLAVLQERDRVFIVHRMGPHECEGVAGGTVQELRSTYCVEVCGDNVVERLALDLDEWPEIWPPDSGGGKDERRLLYHESSCNDSPGRPGV